MKKKIGELTLRESRDYCRKRRRKCKGCPFVLTTIWGKFDCKLTAFNIDNYLNEEVEVDE